HLRARPQGTNIANELLDELLKKEAAGENLPCFFDCPDFVVAGRPYAEYRERSQAAADEKLLLGLALAAGGVLVLVALWLGVY
ncbi:MAG TPA: hypothetical protein VNI01_13950, partial [Elusimicrobiota bacterium]|nr:hypothetical protein [Elusimicrobiota bacterium]